jgi:hypothetical protein
MLIAVIALSLAFFLSKFQVFWSPFQILSHDDIEKNQQGICLAEDRQLDEKELFVRAMQGYWDKRTHSVARDINYEGDVIMRCQKQSLCEYWKIPEPLLLGEYTKAILDRPDTIDFKALMTDYFQAALFEQDSIANLSQYKDGGFPYSILAAEQGRYSLIPSDCCQLLTDKHYSQAFIKKDPEQNTKQQQRGNGHYFIKVKDVLLSKAFSDNDMAKPHHLRPRNIHSTIYSISNCGEFYEEYYESILNSDYVPLSFKDSVLQGLLPTDDSLYWYDDKYIKGEVFESTTDYDEYLKIRKVIDEEARQYLLKKSIK